MMVSLSHEERQTPHRAAVKLPPVAVSACDRCGAPLEEGDRFCPACGAVQKFAERGPPARAFRADTTCDNCGAEIHLEPDQRSYTCQYCGSTYVFDFSPELTGRQAPEFVLGFAISPERARELFNRWLHTHARWTPLAIRRAARRGDLRGIYFPFWSFSMLAESDWQATIGEYWYRQETYIAIENGKSVTKTRTVRETEWWPLAGRYHQFVSGYLISASTNLPQWVIDRLIPFHMAGLRRYDPAYLAGWACQEYTLERAEAEAKCREYYHQYQKQCVANFLPGDTYRGLVVNTVFSQEESDLILLPIYILRFEHKGKTYRLWMNGQTGEIAAQLPVSWELILTIVGLVAAGIVGLYFLMRFLLGL